MIVFLKSFVPGHPSRDANGRTIFVRPHSNKVVKQDPRQDDLFQPTAKAEPPVLFLAPHKETGPPDLEAKPDLSSYDKILVGFSGGKDSVAAVLHLIEQGIPREKIELWHHDIDGAGETFMDWPITPSYVKAVGEALGLPVYFSYREGGFLGEMMRKDAPRAAAVFEKPDGTMGRAGGDSNKLGTRLKFPQVSADLSVRWCSGVGKIDVMDSAIRNQDRFDGKRTLVVTGERAEESSNRARYKTFEPHRATAQKRHVDHYRPVHKYSEKEVWDTMRRHGVVPHPAYQLGYGRLSCRNCIFGGENQWATNQVISPATFDKVADKEDEFGVTIHRTKGIRERAANGTPYAAAIANPDLAKLADSKEWRGPALVSPADWKLPAGAYGEKNGPT